MQLGPRGFALIKSFEQCRLTAYADSAGVPTIGWGHTSPTVRLGDTCTQAQADAWLAADLQTAIKAVVAHTDVPLTQNQFDALVAFTFNVGIGAAMGSTLFKLVNGGHSAEAAGEFVKWDHAGGQVVEGLLRRREAERELFLAP